jgi:hypothetical protein
MFQFIFFSVAAVARLLAANIILMFVVLFVYRYALLYVTSAAALFSLFCFSTSSRARAFCFRGMKWNFLLSRTSVYSPKMQIALWFYCHLFQSASLTFLVLLKYKSKWREWDIEFQFYWHIRLTCFGVNKAIKHNKACFWKEKKFMHFHETSQIVKNTNFYVLWHFACNCCILAT